MGAVKNLVIDISEKKIGKKERMVQFNHVCTYPRAISGKTVELNDDLGRSKKTRKWTVGDIAREADRHDLHIPHVDNPIPPILLAGVKVSEIESVSDELLKSARNKAGKKIRKDTHTLLSAVYSLPIAPDDYLEHRDYCHAFFSDCLSWHNREYGDVASAVMHLDETMVHIHVFTVDQDARGLVAGWREKRKVMEAVLADGGNKSMAVKLGNAAYKKEMKALQDRFYEQVGQRHGLARYGDRRMRYTPDEGRAKRREREAHLVQEREAREREEQDRADLRKEIERQDAERLKLEKEEADLVAQAEALDDERAQQILDRQTLDKDTAWLKEKQNSLADVISRNSEFIKQVKQRPGWEIQKTLDMTLKQLNAAKQDIVELKEEAVERESFIQLLKDRLVKAVQLLNKFVPSEVLRSLSPRPPAPGPKNS